MDPLRHFAVLYDLALTTAGETRAQPLVARMLQRLMYHTEFPCGLFLEVEPGSALARVHTRLCRRQAALVEGATLALPEELMAGTAALIDDAALLKAAFPTSEYTLALRLPVAGHGLFLLLNQGTREVLSFSPTVFDPVLATFARTLGLCEQAERVQQAEREAREAAEAANRAKSEFLSRMSHELRTPLNVIFGVSQLLLLEGPLSADQRRDVEEILGAGEHLLQLINEVLDLSKIEAGALSLTMEEVSLPAAVSDAMALLGVMGRKRGVTVVESVTRGESFLVHADRTRLKQVLLNLGSNAIKYNRPEGEVRVRAARSRPGTVRVSVEDTGYGIEPEKRARIFVPFERLGAERSGVEGTGIGLVITRRLVESMGGTIGFESSPSGTTFWFELEEVASVSASPLSTAQPASRVPRQAGARATLLSIEDNPVNQRLLQGVLERSGRYVFIGASDATVGVELARARHPDVILMDLNLPGLDGFAARRLLAELPETRDIPVLAISAGAMPGDISRARSEGFVDFIAKPIQVDRLYEAIERALQPRP